MDENLQASALAGLEETGNFRVYLNQELGDIDRAQRWHRSRRWLWYAVFTLGLLTGFVLRSHLAI